MGKPQLIHLFLRHWFNFYASVVGPQTGGNVSCNFEPANLCGFKQERSTDDFDWSRSTRSTSSSGTGPSNDHTYKTAAGIYTVHKLVNIFVILFVFMN